MITPLTPETTEPGVQQTQSDFVDIDDVLARLYWHVEPFQICPTWSKDPAWTGPRDPDGYILPELTLGWQAIHWVGENLLSDDIDETDPQGMRRLPFTPTREQIRFILFFYAIDETGRFAYREVVLQRLKGWG